MAKPKKMHFIFSKEDEFIKVIQQYLLSKNDNVETVQKIAFENKKSKRISRRVFIIENSDIRTLHGEALRAGFYKNGLVRFYWGYEDDNFITQMYPSMKTISTKNIENQLKEIQKGRKQK